MGPLVSAVAALRMAPLAIAALLLLPTAAVLRCCCLWVSLSTKPFALIAVASAKPGRSGTPRPTCGMSSYSWLQFVYCGLRLSAFRAAIEHAAAVLQRLGTVYSVDDGYVLSTHCSVPLQFQC